MAQVLQETGLDPSCLKIEITESVLMRDTARSISELNRLKALGVRIAVDDFGTGYSSLSYLRQLPIDHLKIDRSFISGSDNVEDNVKIVTSIISLARNLGLTVIAEGVEREDQFARLQSVRCDKAQGYMFSRPVDGVAAGRYIRESLRRSPGPGPWTRRPPDLSVVSSPPPGGKNHRCNFLHNVCILPSSTRQIVRIKEENTAYGKGAGMTPDISALTGFTLSTSVTGAVQVDGSPDDKASGGISAASGDTVTISEEGKRLASSSETFAVAQGASEADDDDDSTAAKVKQRIKDVQTKIKELQEQIRAVEEENLSEKQKQQKIQQLQDQLAQYQAQLADLQRALYGSSGNPGGTRAEGMSSSLT